jgi:hypothetical protein
MKLVKRMLGHIYMFFVIFELQTYKKDAELTTINSFLYQHN